MSLMQISLSFRKTNTTYNQADAIIAHCDDMKQHLIRLGVESERIHVVLHGTKIPSPPENGRREGIVFYGGHKLMSAKGIETVFHALSVIRERRPESLPVLKIHGHYGSVTPGEAVRLAQRYGVADRIHWLNQISEEEMVHLYQHSQLFVLPYTGSFGGYAASTAAACELPVLCTRKAGLPDHLGDTAIWIEENNPTQLAARIEELLDDEPGRQELGRRLLQRAKDYLCWDAIAGQTVDIYEKAVRNRMEAAA